MALRLLQIVLENLQRSIREAIMGPGLPPANASGRTAFEIDVRQQEFEAVELPMSLRLLTELDFPLANRVLSILSSPAMVGSPYYVPPFEVDGERIRPKPTSPLVRLLDIAADQILEGGVDAVTNPCQNMSNMPVEIMEATYPIRIEEYGLRPDSCGAGKQRNRRFARHIEKLDRRAGRDNEL